MQYSAKKILIVDDDKDTCELILRELESKRYEVLCSYNGREALKLCEATKFDLIIADVFMPQVDGTEILAKVKSQYPDTIVLMITGMGDNELWIDLMNKGAHQLVTKPFRPFQIRRIVDKALIKEDIFCKSFFFNERFTPTQL